MLPKRVIGGLGLTMTLFAGIASIKYKGFPQHEQRIDLRDIPGLTVAAESRLPSLETSQMSKVVRVEKFISKEQIKQLLEYAEANRDQLGRRKRDAKGVIKYKDDYTWETLFLHTDGKFHSNFPKLLDDIQRLILEVDLTHKWNLLLVEDKESCSASSGASSSASRYLAKSINPRTIEIHEVLPNGGLPDKKHFDGGSLITVDIMLTDPENGDFSGADFTTLESGDSGSGGAPFLQKHSFNQGDALIFQSHKFHCIQPLVSGRRKVLVLEFWQGDLRTCAHRCTKRYGDCRFSRVEGEIEAMMQSLAEDI